MYFKVLRENAPPGEKNIIRVDLSKMSTIDELKTLIFKQMNIDKEKQRLFCYGKELQNDKRIVDYNIKLNDVVKVITRSIIPVANANEEFVINDEKGEEEQDIVEKLALQNLLPAQSDYYKNGDLIDFMNVELGCWEEGKIEEIFKNQRLDSESSKESNLSFKIITERDDQEIYVMFDDIRPRAVYNYKKNELKEGLKVLANYNIDKPQSRGFWFDFEIESVKDSHLKGTLFVGNEKTTIKDCKIKFIKEIKKIEYPKLLSEKTEEIIIGPVALRSQAYNCNTCKDNKSRKCKNCGCKVCFGKSNPEIIILCDECNDGYHSTCLTPPLKEVPSDDWYCPKCKIDDREIVKPGDELKMNKKRAKMPSNNQNGNSRDWGRGMACVGRTVECTIVPKHHYGPIPGIDVGTCWMYRVQVSEAGVHRPPVAGIHGSNDGAYSLVLSGGYEGDIDNGNEFCYTGSGGRNLSGNKRVSKQSCDQTLTRMNKALAMNCNAKFNDEFGAVATNWKDGKPVRVVRSSKLKKYSKYAPNIGNRYDGIYKVVKYYPDKSESGFKLWKFLLRRDDPTPAPWQKGGQELDVIYPPGYLEAEVENEKKSPKKKGKKRLIDISDLSSTKKIKLETYNLDDNVKRMIEKDIRNKKYWDECMKSLSEGKLLFLAKVKEWFTCAYCREIIKLPVTTECNHNFCQKCLKQSFSTEVHVCPHCRLKLDVNCKIQINSNLSNILKLLFCGYEVEM